MVSNFQRWSQTFNDESELSTTRIRREKKRDGILILCDNATLLSSQADYFIHRDQSRLTLTVIQFFDSVNLVWEGSVALVVGARPSNDDRKMYGIWMSFSPTESPSTADELATFATSSLKKWGAAKQNHLGIERLKTLPLGGRGWLIILDFPEYPNMDIIDYTINLNK
ncbi:hypothetical protein C8F01DRAFT_1095194 [Mycena amicta]|nr:hypothetical protein C8F01DRAFT_1095194 [Mycena amicta]